MREAAAAGVATPGTGTPATSPAPLSCAPAAGGAGRPVAVVTGASSGIGRWIALGLARTGHHVVLVARDRARGEAARDWIAAQVPGAATELVVLDLASLAATRAAGAAIAARHPRLVLLVNNAGIYRARREETAEGRELVLAVNHLAPFALTQALLGALRAGAPARIVNVGSSVAERAALDPDDLELRRGWNMVRAYGRSKLAMLTTTLDLAARLADSGVTANVVHPGPVNTGIVRDSALARLAWRAVAPLLLTAEQGAAAPLHVALSSALTGESGHYFRRTARTAPNRRALDPELRRRVWEATERLVG